MNELKIFENPAFGKVRVVEQGGEPWFVGKDVAEALEYSNPQKAIRDHVKDTHKTVNESFTVNGTSPVLIDEAGVYTLVMRSKLPQAEEFQEWVTAEVLPTIRKTGGYIAGSENMSKEELFARAILWAQETITQREARIAELETENTVQRQAIADFKPTQEYVDKILASKDVVTTTQIAADYGMSAVQLNMFLSEQRVQRVVGGQWILYKNHMGKGYTKSETIRIKHRDGSEGIKMQTKWTQKGRLFIHNLLTSKGYKANMDKEGA